MTVERDLLNAWLCIAPHIVDPAYEKLHKTTKKILDKPEQEPVAWIDGGIGGGTAVGWYDKDIIDLPKGTKLYTHPPKREPLDDREISHGFRISKKAIHAESFWIGVKFAEKAHGIGE